MSVLEKPPLRPGQHVHYEDILDKDALQETSQPQTPSVGVNKEAIVDAATTSPVGASDVLNSPVSARGGDPPPSVHDPYVSQMKAIGAHAYARHATAFSGQPDNTLEDEEGDGSKQMRDRLKRALEIQAEIFEMHDKLEREAEPRRHEAATKAAGAAVQGTAGAPADGGTPGTPAARKAPSSSGKPTAGGSSTDDTPAGATTASGATVEQLLDAMDDEDRQMRAIVDRLSALSDVMHDFHRIPLPALEFPSAASMAAKAAKMMASLSKDARSRGNTFVIDTPASVSPVSPEDPRVSQGEGGDQPRRAGLKRPPRRAWTVATPGDAEGSIW